MATELFLKEDKVKPGDCSGDFGMWGVGQCYLPPWPTGAAWGAKISSQPHQALYGHWVEGYPPLQLHRLLQDRQGYHRNQLQPFPCSQEGPYSGCWGRSLWEQLFARIFLSLEQVVVVSKTPQGPQEIAESWGDVL